MRKKNKGFTMVELLAVIVILGILAIVSITAVQGIIAKARDRYYKSQEENLVMATQSYLQNNKSLQPKASGQLVTVYLKDLREAKYIDEIIDYKKNTCNVTKSYVKVFKYEEELYYTAYLECPNYKTNINSYTSNIDISASFKGDSQNLNKAGVTVTIKDNNNAKDASGNPVTIPTGIVSYQYKIFVDGELKYTSDLYNAKKIAEENKTISLINYTPGVVKVSVTATNMYGLSLTKSFTKSYRDKTSPTCTYVYGDSTTWKTGTRTITVGCSDGNGSGCKRDEYTYEFTGDVEVGRIKIEDKSGNQKWCDVNVYIDNNPPVIELKIYKKKKDSNAKADNNIMGSTKTSNTNTTKNVKLTKGLYGGEWLNKANFPNGVYLELNYGDISSTTEIEWKWNDANTTSADKTLKSNKKINPKTKNGTTSAVVDEDGYREGQIIATDLLGHKSIINVTIPLDRVAPTYTTTGESDEYVKGTREITLDCMDNISGCVKTIEKYSYEKTIITDDKTIYDKAGNKTNLSLNVYLDNTPPKCETISNDSTKWQYDDRKVTVDCSDKHSKCSSLSESKNFSKTTKEGIIEIYDKVGNSAECKVNVYVDKTPPICNGTDKEPTDWSNQDRIVYAKCKDEDSGCDEAKVPKKFTKTAETGKITIKDIVGNTADCTVNVKIDKEKPTCGTKTENTSWTNETKTVKVQCNDTGGSGCSEKSKKVNYSTTKVTLTLKDGAGNTADCTLKAYVDKEAPTCGTKTENTSWTNETQIVKVKCNDEGGSGCSEQSKKVNYTAMKVTITLTDGANNSTDCKVRSYVDKTPPSVWTTYGPNGESCSDAKGVKTIYKVKDEDSGISYVGDWWGWADNPNNLLEGFNKNNALERKVTKGTSEFTKTHHWSANCRTVNSPGNYCYRIKVYATDVAGNETKFVSGTCAYKG